MRAATRLLGCLALTVLFVSAQTPSSDWRTIDYGALVDGRQLSHSGEPVAVLLRKLDGRPLPKPGERPADLTAHILLDPLLEPYAFVLSDALDSLNPPADPPLAEVGSLWQPGEAQPAWVELLRARSMILESDGRGKLRAILPVDPGHPEISDSVDAARAAWDKAWPVLRLALAAERRRLAAQAKDRPQDQPLEVTVFPFRRLPARTRFELGVAPYRVTVTDTRPRGDRPPLDLAAWQRFLASGQRLEGARVIPDGGVRLFGSEAPARPSILGRPISLSDFAVAYRAVFHGGVGEPYMSLDRGLSPQVSLVNYGGRLRDTALGAVSLLCDVRFKTFSQGIDSVTGADVRDDVRRRVPGFRAHVERFAADARSEAAQGQQTRFWFYPDAVELLLSAQGDLMALSRARMTAASERVDAATMQPIKGEDPPWTKDAIAEINQDYDALGVSFPELADLDEVVRLLSLFTWLRQASAEGLLVPELDILLAVDLPESGTPRRFPQLLAFNALPPAGSPTPVVVLDRATLAENLERLAAPDGRPLPAARRRLRALNALDRKYPDQAAVAKELESLPPESAEETLLDALTYKAERLRMHRLALTSLTAAEKAPLQKRARAGEALRVFSLGIGGLDLGMGTTLSRASRRAGRLNFAAAAAGVLIADGSAGGAGASSPAQPAARAGDSSRAPREEWRTDPPELPPTSPPGQVGPGAAVQIVRSAGAKPGAVRTVQLIYGADGPEARSRALTLEANGRVQRFERLEDRRLLRYSLSPRADEIAAVNLPPDPPLSTQAASPVAGLLLVEPIRAAEETPGVSWSLRRAGAAPISAEAPRSELQRLILGGEAGASGERSDEPIAALARLFGSDAKLMFVAGRDAAAPWTAVTGPIPGEEDAVTLADAVNRWWSSAPAGAPRRTAVVGVDPARSAGRWSKAPSSGASASLLAPDDAFPGLSGALRTELSRDWKSGPFFAVLPANVTTNVVVLVSAEPPGLLGARLRSLSKDPALRGKLLAVLSFGGPIRRDLPASLLSAGGLAGLGIAEAPPAGQPRWLRELVVFGEALVGPRAEDRRIEDLPGPFLWRF